MEDIVSIAVTAVVLLVLAFGSIDGCRIVFRGVRDYLARADGRYRFLVGCAAFVTGLVAFASGVAVVVSVVGWVVHGMRPWRSAPYEKAPDSLYQQTGYPKRG